MKLTTAVLAAGAAVSLTIAVVGAARLRQDARHRAERNEAVVARNQLDWLAQMSTNADLAKLWAPEDMDVEEYMQLLKANQLICTLSLRDRLGFVRDGHLPFFASMVMSSDVCRATGTASATSAPGRPRATRGPSTSPGCWTRPRRTTRRRSPQQPDGTTHRPPDVRPLRRLRRPSPSGSRPRGPTGPRHPAPSTTPRRHA
ncbi:hypothetical protein [Streptomyces sp. SD15]